MDDNSIVSIVVPVYNAEKFLKDTIKTVIEQTYSNWELIFVDDCSKDRSVEIIKNAMKSNSKIKFFKNEVDSGAALTRNKGIDEAKGKYICFLDADDLWEKDKLEKQIKFMQDNKCTFSFTAYEFADENGVANGKKVYMPDKINYKKCLKNPIIWTSTVMLDMTKLSKDDVHMPNVKRGQDAATWWKILKKVEYAYSLNEVLSYYRRTNNSLSANKFKAIKRTWFLYRKVEHLNVFVAAYNFVFYAFNAVKKRI